MASAKPTKAAQASQSSQATQPSSSTKTVKSARGAVSASAVDSTALTNAATPPIPKGLWICFVLICVLFICAIATLFVPQDSFFSDIFVEVSVIVVFIAGFFQNTRKRQFRYLIGANIYMIFFLVIFGKVFYDNYSKGTGVLLLIQIIFSILNIIPICYYHLRNSEFYFAYQRQLIFPTLFFTFILLGHMPGGEELAAETSHEIFGLIIFTQAFNMLDAIHKIGQANHMAVYSTPSAPGAPAVAAESSDDDDEEEEV